jgi:cofilin
MKLRRAYAYLILRITPDASEIVVENTLTLAEATKIGAEAAYDQLVSQLPANEGRYIVYDLEYRLGLEGIRNKLIFIAWNPEDGQVRSRYINLIQNVVCVEQGCTQAKARWTFCGSAGD